MVAILLTGDVMLGRGIDQILPSPSEPILFEPWVKSALGYVVLAEAKCGPIPRGVPFDYVWGDALDVFRRADVRIINLETALTCCEEPAPKGINYRCHPANVPVLEAAGIDCCVLANNHVLDWGEAGLIETLDALHAAGFRYAGAGRNLEEAEGPAILPMPDGGRILIYALGAGSAGVPHSWAAGPARPGIHFLEDVEVAVDRIARRLAAEKQAGDIAIVSVHWGPNWGYDVPSGERRFARRLVDEAGVDIVHGHSSHHPKAVELYRGRPILYGCGDFLNDYEGISGKEEYRSELVLAYRIVVRHGEATVEMLPYRIAQFRLNRPGPEEAEWLAAMLDRECGAFGGRVVLDNSSKRLQLMAA